MLQKCREKRRRRVWYKKVRYGCRKNLADRRLRIKGRFVRADSEEYKAYFANLAKKAAEEKAVTQKVKEKLHLDKGRLRTNSIQENLEKVFYHLSVCSK